MTWILENKEWLFSGIGLAVIVYILNLIFHPFKNKDDNKTTINITNNQNNSKNAFPNIDQANLVEKLQSKEEAKILFVDDEHTKFKIVSILKKSGWTNTKSVKDITDLDDIKVKESHLIFVDINGVGKTLFEDEGLGLASALKDKYPSKKVVIYSSDNDGDRFHKALRKVDDCLPKNAEPFQFISLVETLLH